MSELEEDIKHCEEVLANWKGCDECKADHERLLSYMEELLEFRKQMTDNTDWVKNKTKEFLAFLEFKIDDIDDFRETIEASGCLDKGLIVRANVTGYLDGKQDAFMEVMDFLGNKND